MILTMTSLLNTGDVQYHQKIEYESGCAERIATPRVGSHQMFFSEMLNEKFMTSDERRKHMGRIKTKDTKPECLVRRLCRSRGYTCYRLHRRDIAGCPDICFVSERKAIFVNGCFWHGHSCKDGPRRPKSNCSYWHNKIAANQDRDTRIAGKLSDNDWKVLVIKEAQLKALVKLHRKLSQFSMSADST
jgi:DNA mismatch endonuclease (patch repair protein)